MLAWVVDLEMNDIQARSPQHLADLGGSCGSVWGRTKFREAEDSKLTKWPSQTKMVLPKGKGPKEDGCYSLRVFLQIDRMQWAAWHLRKTTDTVYIETVLQQSPPAVVKQDQIREHRRCPYTTDMGGCKWRFPPSLPLPSSLCILEGENAKEWFVQSWIGVCLWMRVGDRTTKVGTEEGSKKQNRYSWCHSHSLMGEDGQARPRHFRPNFMHRCSHGGETVYIKWRTS